MSTRKWFQSLLSGKWWQNIIFQNGLIITGIIYLISDNTGGISNLSPQPKSVGLGLLAVSCPKSPFFCCRICSTVVLIFPLHHWINWSSHWNCTNIWAALRHNLTSNFLNQRYVDMLFPEWLGVSFGCCWSSFWKTKMFCKPLVLLSTDVWLLLFYLQPEKLTVLLGSGRGS